MVEGGNLGHCDAGHVDTMRSLAHIQHSALAVVVVVVVVVAAAACAGSGTCTCACACTAGAGAIAGGGVKEQVSHTLVVDFHHGD